MGLEVRGLPSDIRPKYSNRLKSYEKELQRLEKDYVCIIFYSGKLLVVAIYKSS